LLDGVGAAVAESEVVLGGAAFVAVAFDVDLLIRIALEEGSGFFESYTSVGTDVGLVEVEVSIANFLGEEFFKAGTLRRRRRRRSANRDADVGVSAAAGAGGGDGVSSGVGGGDGGGALRGDRADFGSNGNIGGIGGGPGELGGFTLVDDGAIGGNADGGLGGYGRRSWRRRRSGGRLLIARGNKEESCRSENEKRAVQRGVRMIHSCPPRTLLTGFRAKSTGRRIIPPEAGFREYIATRYIVK